MEDRETKLKRPFHIVLLSPKDVGVLGTDRRLERLVHLGNGKDIAIIFLMTTPESVIDFVNLELEQVAQHEASFPVSRRSDPGTSNVRRTN